MITLTKTVKDDLHSFFQFQLDKEANYLAAFTAKDPTDKSAYMEKYSTFLNNPSINMRTIKVNTLITGSIAKFVMEGEANITYWIDRNFWGQGIATSALHSFLKIETIRPIHARVAFDNFGSQKVLEKCGFYKEATLKASVYKYDEYLDEHLYAIFRNVNLLQ